MKKFIDTDFKFFEKQILFEPFYLNKFQNHFKVIQLIYQFDNKKKIHISFRLKIFTFFLLLKILI